ncbi:hypothetical protein H1R20_g2964, partial [Candolleomyces eurysporus]
MSIAGETPRAIFPNPFCDPALVALAIETGLLPRDEDEQSLLSDIEILVDDSLPDPDYSASESDDDNATTYTYNSRLLQTRSSQMAPTFAKSIRSSNNKSPPTLTEGKVNPDVLKTWERGCIAYFGQRKVLAGDQVRQVLDSLDNTRTINWVGHRREELAKMNFPDFMNLFRKHALDSDWHLDLKKRLQRRTQGEEEAFEDFANEVCALNTLLVDAPKSSFTHERLHEILLAGAHDNINELYISSELPDKYVAAEWGKLELDVLNNWIINMVKIDKRVTNERKRARRLIEEQNKRSKNGGAGNDNKKTSSDNKENTGGESLDSRSHQGRTRCLEGPPRLLQVQEVLHQSRSEGLQGRFPKGTRHLHQCSGHGCKAGGVEYPEKEGSACRGGGGFIGDLRVGLGGLQGQRLRIGF